MWRAWRLEPAAGGKPAHSLWARFGRAGQDGLSALVWSPDASLGEEIFGSASVISAPVSSWADRASRLHPSCRLSGSVRTSRTEARSSAGRTGTDTRRARASADTTDERGELRAASHGTSRRVALWLQHSHRLGHFAGPPRRPFTSRPKPAGGPRRPQARRGASTPRASRTGPCTRRSTSRHAGGGRATPEPAEASPHVRPAPGT